MDCDTVFHLLKAIQGGNFYLLSQNLTPTINRITFKQTIISNNSPANNKTETQSSFRKPGMNYDTIPTPQTQDEETISVCYHMSALANRKPGDYSLLTSLSVCRKNNEDTVFSWRKQVMTWLPAGEIPTVRLPLKPTTISTQQPQGWQYCGRISPSDTNGGKEGIITIKKRKLTSSQHPHHLWHSLLLRQTDSSFHQTVFLYTKTQEK